MSKFCILPWINLTIDVNGSTRPCCRFDQPQHQNKHKLPFIMQDRLDKVYNNDSWQKLRQAFLNGEKPTECRSCWDDEKSGIPSYREVFVQSKFVDVSKVDVNSLTVEAPLTLDLKLNNVCNLKCRICSPQQSSTYAKEFKLLYNITYPNADYYPQDKITNTQHEEVIAKWGETVQHIEMSGGEPMNSPENVKVLKLINEKSDLKNKTILINTNVTQWNKQLIDYLTMFKKSIICLSVDDLYDRQEYHRFPSKWDNIIENIDKFIALRDEFPNVELLLFCTVSNFNVYYVPEYKVWADSKKLPVHWNMLHSNPKYCIHNLPTLAKSRVKDKLTDFPDIVNFMMLPQEDGHWQEFIDELEILDEHRGQNFDETFAEWSEIIGRY